jgi:hypothetical protein
LNRHSFNPCLCDDLKGLVISTQHAHIPHARFSKPTKILWSCCTLYYSHHTPDIWHIKMTKSCRLYFIISICFLTSHINRKLVSRLSRHNEEIWNNKLAKNSRNYILQLSKMKKVIVRLFYFSHRQCILNLRIVYFYILDIRWSRLLLFHFT